MLGRQLTESERSGLLAGEHAGSWETSFMLAERPELVQSGYEKLGLDGPPTFRPLAALGDRLVRWRGRRGHDITKLQQAVQALSKGIGWLLNARYGYGGPVVCYQGNPSVASAEIGKAFREIMVQECLDIVQGVTAGQVSAGDVRSIASDHAIVQPNFWARVGFATALVILVLLMF
jgi:creatinine amidohydrolase/Fe(II)-dependent formamide hydrolase-like protein